MNKSVSVPTHDSMMNPLLEALQSLGGSATIEEMVTQVARIAGITEEQLQVPHGNRGRSEVEYRLAWTRTYLKVYGYLENSSRGVWALTPAGKRAGRVDPRDVVRVVAALSKKTRPKRGNTEQLETLLDDEQAELTWRDQVLDNLQAMAPGAFERLAQRLLRESGFIQVEVTGRSGDGGIDGQGSV